jgi:amidophosphoribosyltransferase
MEVLPQLRGAFSLVWMDEHPVRGARPAGHPPAGARPPRARLGRRERDPRAGHRRRVVRPRDRARRAGRDRRGRPAFTQRFAEPQQPPAASSSTSTSPAPTRASPGAPCTRRASRWAASWPRSTPSRPTWSSRCRSPARPRPSATPRRRASRSGRACQERLRRPHVHPAESQTLRQLGIRLKLNPLREVIRGKRLVVVDDSIVRGNTQRALSGCSARPAPPRCTSGSPARRSSGRASTASTSRPARS